ncbi:MAG: CAP domain-containing protein [Pseudomonadota bacterium]
MTRLTTLFAVVALAVSGCVVAPQASGPAPDAAAVVASAPQGSFLSLLNQFRAEQGRGGVTQDAALTRAAQAHAADMAANNYFSHTGLNGSRFTQRARAAGYGCAMAENIAFGQRSEAQVFENWVNSSGHRRNMLLSGATEYGLGRTDTHWVLMLGTGC